MTLHRADHLAGHLADDDRHRPPSRRVRSRSAGRARATRAPEAPPRGSRLRPAWPTGTSPTPPSTRCRCSRCRWPTPTTSRSRRPERQVHDRVGRGHRDRLGAETFDLHGRHEPPPLGHRRGIDGLDAAGKAVEDGEVVHPAVDLVVARPVPTTVGIGAVPGGPVPGGRRAAGTNLYDPMLSHSPAATRFTRSRKAAGGS